MESNQDFFCKKCGEKISESARICPFCGAKLKKAEKAKKKKKGRLAKFLIVLTWIILILAIIAIALFCVYKFALRSFDCKELLEVHFDGSNKSGIGYVTLNDSLDLFTATETGEDGTPLLSKAYDTETDEAKELQEALMTYIYIADDPRDATYKTEVDGIIHTGTTLSKMTGIKNGDVITVSVSFDRFALLKKGIRLENTEYEIKVSGLSSDATLDPFDGVSFSFTGVDGYGKAEIDLSGCSDAVIDNFTYSISPNSGLSEGSEITVTATYKGESYDETTGTIEYGGKFYSIEKESKKTVTVGSLGNVDTLDPFEGVSIIYEGIDPYLKISGYDTSTSPKAVAELFDFEASVSENLTVGQVITVKAVYKTVDGVKYTDNDLKSYGYTLLKTERTYTVPSTVSRYARSADDFDRNKVSEGFSQYLSKYKAGESKVSLVKCYFANKKEDADASYNKYYEVYKIVTGGNTVYAVVWAEGIYKDSSGSYKYTSGEYDSTGPNLEKIVNSAIMPDEAEYNITEATVQDSPVNNYNVEEATTESSTENTTASE